ncbi:cellulase family glycosylhydrolase [Priestia aryabhattai]|uniref:cellulase family glycosylhydrolase n=1 Tax=Priestia aryabhattai TaxID=412384 RepID=UPI003CA605C8
MKKKLLLFSLSFLLGICLIVSHFVFDKSSDPKISREYQSFTEGIGVNIDSRTSEEDLQNIVDAGFKWVRVDMTWENIESKKESYDFEKSGYDKLNKSLKEKRLKPYYIFDYSNKLYESNRSIMTSDGLKAYMKFVDVVTKRYKNQNAIWEIWNEPNIEMFWNPQPSYKQYSLLVKKVAPIIKKNDPNSRVVAPALAGIHQESLKWLQQFFKQGTLKYIDAVSVHPYRFTNPEDALKDYKELKIIIRQYTNRDIPIISGEWGYSILNTPTQHLTEMQQADYVIRMFLVNAEEGIPISILYNWKNNGFDPNNKEHNFGVLWYSGKPKLSYLAIQTFTSRLDGYKFSRAIKYGRDDTYILEFQNSDRQKLLSFWTTGTSYSFPFRLDSGKGKLYSMLGGMQNIEWDRKVELNISSSPNYLVID